MISFSLLISVYDKDNPDFLDHAFTSIYDQTVRPDQIVLVEDGGINPALDEIIVKWNKKFGRECFERVHLRQNEGLANALNEGLQHCRNEWVARMDSDDYSVKTRFEDQIQYLEKHPDYSVVGGWTEQRDHDLNQILGYKKHPLKHEEISRKARWRCPMAHVTVMYRKSHILDAGGYDTSYSSGQDYALWSLMLVKKYTFANIPKILVLVRSGKEMVFRRGGRKYFRNEIRILRYQKEIGLLTGTEYFRNLMIRLAFRFLPVSLRHHIYYRYLRVKTI